MEDINNNNNNNNNESTSTTNISPPLPPTNTTTSANFLDELVAAAELKGRYTQIQLEELKSKLDNTSLALNVDQDTIKLAWCLLENMQLLSPDTSEQFQKHIVACSLFICGNKRFNHLLYNLNNNNNKQQQQQEQQQQEDQHQQDNNINNNNNNNYNNNSNNNELIQSIKTCIGEIQLHTLQNSVLLSQLLKYFNGEIKISQFFETLRSFICNLRLGHAFEEQGRSLEQTYYTQSNLFRKYEQIFYSLFHPSNNYLLKLQQQDSISGSSGNNTQQQQQQYGKSNEEYLLSIGWLIFLNCKNKLFSKESPDFVQSLHLLLCIINFIYTNTSMMELKKVPDLKIIDPVTGDILSHISKALNCNHDDLMAVNKFTFQELLSTNTIFKSSVSPPPSSSSSSSSSILKPSFFTSQNKIIETFNSLNKSYELYYYQNGDLDERLFHPDNLDQININNNNNSNNNNNNNNNINNSLMKRLFTPNSKQTPISSTLSLESWLKLEIKNYKEPYPSLNLISILKSVNSPEITSEQSQPQQQPEILDKIINRIKSLTSNLDILFDQQQQQQTSPTTTTPTTPTTPTTITNPLSFKSENDVKERRKNMAIQLYYCLLEKLIKHEQNTTSKIKILLNHEDFHKSLLSSSFEIIAFVYKMEGLYFPHFINVFRLHAFSYCRLIELILKVDGGSPKSLQVHFNQIEEKILEKYVWAKNSAVFHTLKNENLSNFLPQQQPQPQSTPSHLRATQVFSTPTKNHSNNPHLQSATTSSSTPLPPPTPTKNPYISSFVKKVVALINIKCRKLAQAMGLHNDHLVQTCSVMNKIFIEETNLFRNREIDILLICSIYAVCKVNSVKDVTFKSIIDKSGISAKVYKEVYLNDNESDGTPIKGDVISFYNKVFLTKMDPFIYEIFNNFQKSQAQAQQTQYTHLQQSSSTLLPPPSPSNSLNQWINNNISMKSRNPLFNTPTKNNNNNPHLINGSNNNNNNSNSNNNNLNINSFTPTKQSSSSTPISPHKGNNGINNIFTVNNRVTISPMKQLSSGGGSGSGSFTYIVARSPSHDLLQINQQLNRVATPKKEPLTSEIDKSNTTTNTKTPITDISNDNKNSGGSEKKTTGKRLLFDSDEPTTGISSSTTITSSSSTSTSSSLPSTPTDVENYNSPNSSPPDNDNSDKHVDKRLKF